MARAAWRQRVDRAAVGLLAGALGTVAVQARAAGTGAQAAGAWAPVSHVRGLPAGVYDGARLLAEAREACPTVRQLLEALEETDVFVLVEIRDRVLNRTGHLTFVGTAHGSRWLRITIDARNRRLEQFAWLAHELRHAVEVAGAPDVQNVDGLRRFYTRVGMNLGEGQFETDAAVAAGREALREAYEAAARRK